MRRNCRIEAATESRYADIGNALLCTAMFKELGRSFKTTNCIENLNSLINNRTKRVDRWRNSEQKHRWLATAILDIEPRLPTVAGYRHLPRLRAVLQSSTNRSGKAVA